MRDCSASKDSLSAPCPHCGRVLPPEVAADFCPNCLLDGVEHDLAENGADGMVIPMQFVGNYELLEPVGRGGTGVVYRARQRTSGATVAIKMLSAGLLASREVLQRFRNETRAAAQLEHANIVRIHETGEQDGQPFFAMDYISGGTLADSVQRRPMPAHAAAACVGKVARAIAYAHGKGVLHRDLKPANILMDDLGEPHVSDFGLAKHLDAPGSLTGSLQILGSPSYMAPEQATGSSRAVDGRADVYALGAVLYHLITGRPPFHGSTPQAILRDVIERDPVLPRKLDATIPKEVETICLKCLEKSPARRYASAAALADDLARHLRGDPIEARSVSFAGRGRRWVARHPAISALSGALAAAIITGLIFVFQSNATLRDSDAQKAAALDSQTSTLAESLLWQAEFQRLTGQPGQRDNSLKVVREALALPLNPEQRMRARNAVIAALALPDATFAPWPIAGLPDDPARVICDAKQERVAALADGKLTIFKAGDGSVLTTHDLAAKHAEALLKFTPDGKIIALRCAGNVLAMVDAERGWKWSQQMWKEGPPITAAQVAFNPQSEQHYLRFTSIPVTVSTVYLPHPDNGGIVEREMFAGFWLGNFGARAGHPGGLCWKALSLAPRAEGITALHVDGTADVIALPRGATRYTVRPASPGLMLSHEVVNAFLISSANGVMSVWTDPRRERPTLFEGHGQPVEVCAWVPGGHRFAAASNDGSILLYDRSIPRPVLTLPGRSASLLFDIYDEDRLPGQFRARLAAVQRDGRWGRYDISWPYVRVLSDAQPGEGNRGMASYQGMFRMGGSGVNRIMGALDATGVNCWTSSPPTGEHLHFPQERPAAIAAPRSGPWLLAAGPSGLYRHYAKPDRNLIFDPADVEKSSVLLPGNFTGLSLSDDNKLLALVDAGRSLVEVRAFDAKVSTPGELLWSVPHGGAQQCLFSPDQKLLVLSREEPCSIRIVSAADGTEVTAFPASAARHNWQPAFSPDMKWLALSGRTCDLYRVADWQPGPAVPAPANQGNNHGVTFAGSQYIAGKDRLALAVTGADDQVHLYRFAGESLEPLCILRHAAGTGPGELASTAYGSIIAATRRGEVHIWDVPSIRAELKKLGLDW